LEVQNSSNVQRMRSAKGKRREVDKTKRQRIEREERKLQRFRGGKLSELGKQEVMGASQAIE